MGGKQEKSPPVAAGRQKLKKANSSQVYHTGPVAAGPGQNKTGGNPDGFKR